MINPTCRFRLWTLLALALLGALRGNPSLQAHELLGHKGPTYEITAPAVLPPSQNRLIPNIVDGKTGKPAAARFSLTVNGKEYVPESLSRHGLRFVSIREGKKQRMVACYSRGTGAVDVPLPTHVQPGTVRHYAFRHALLACQRNELPLVVHTYLKTPRRLFQL